MPKLIHIASARAAAKPRTCAICRHQVQVGEPYKHITHKTGPSSGFRENFCHQCSPRPSHFLSGRARQLAEICETFEDNANQAWLPDLKEALTTLAEDINGLADDIQDSADSITDGMGHSTAQSDAMEETARDLQDWADALTAHAEDCPDTREADCEEHGQVAITDKGQCPQCQAILLPDPDEMTDAEQEWFEEGYNLARQCPELNLTG